MAKQAIDLKKELEYYKFLTNLLQKIDCTKEEEKEYENLIKSNKPLPDGVYQYNEDTNIFYKLHKPDLTKEEIEEYLNFKVIDYLRSIKNFLMLFSVLSIISLISTLILLLSR